jgi:hypothetical protein
MANKFCSVCGAPRSGPFCSSCGAAAGGVTQRSQRPGRLWAAGGFLLLAVTALVLTVRRERSRAVPAAESIPGGTAESGTPPDLSTMTPRERFDRLYNRVMRAAEQGDSATVLRFSPMAFGAYSQLDTVDADARYHAAVLRLHVQSDTAAALRLADTILQQHPRHLFGFLVRGMAGRLVGDERLLSRASADFLAAWDSELKVGRPEYRDHQAMLDQFRASSAPQGKRPEP